MKTHIRLENDEKGVPFKWLTTGNRNQSLASRIRRLQYRSSSSKRRRETVSHWKNAILRESKANVIISVPDPFLTETRRRFFPFLCVCLVCIGSPRIGPEICFSFSFLSNWSPSFRRNSCGIPVVLFHHLLQWRSKNEEEKKSAGNRLSVEFSFRIWIKEKFTVRNNETIKFSSCFTLLSWKFNWWNGILLDLQLLLL